MRLLQRGHLAQIPAGISRRWSVPYFGRRSQFSTKQTPPCARDVRSSLSIIAWALSAARRGEIIENGGRAGASHAVLIIVGLTGGGCAADPCPPGGTLMAN